MIASRDPQANLAILGALADELERYLSSDELALRVVYELPSGRDASTLTLGVLLDITESLSRAASRLSAADRVLLADLAERLDEIRERRSAAYETKLARELKSHLDSWSWFLDDCVRGEDSCRDDYRAEAWLRTRVQQLMAHAARYGFAVGDAARRTSELDSLLMSRLEPGEYLGPEGDEAIYPRSQYWWLYGLPALSKP